MGRGMVALAVVCVCGCATTKRFEAAHAVPWGDGADGPLAARVQAKAVERRASFLVCIDRLAERTGISGRQTVALTLSARPQTTWLLDVKPASGGSVVDESLRTCLVEAVSDWDLAAPQGRVRVEISVLPHPSAEVGIIHAAANRRSDFRPSE